MSIIKKSLLFSALLVGANGLAGPIPIDATNENFVVVNTNAEPVASGKFEPSWDSLKQYQCPQWFRDAKFGIWAHWGPQCQPEDGDWYARWMYLSGSGPYRFHTNHYGSPSEFGFKDVIHEWKAENWDPDKLIALYKRAGAQYFFALANHHDNFDNWDSKYQPWNSVAIGPKKDLIGGWAAAARKNGLRFGVSVHAAHAWSWYEPAQDYDGKLTRADGKGKWWDGLDPQDLYAQNHQPSPNYRDAGSIHSRWNWGNGVTLPDQAYCDKFYNRTVDLINKYHPDLLYFDDTALPLWPISDAGLKIAAHFYNRNNQWHGTNDDGVLFGKILTPDQQKCMVWDIERGQANEIEPYPWQTDTCIGGWHYSRSEYEKNHYKDAKTVIQMLTDIVSKNGNLLLSIPVRGDGTIDEKELKVVQDIADWMDVNKECIFGTRPWKVFGEGPASAGAKLTAQGFNEGKGKPFTAEDVRFTLGKDGSLYAIVLGIPQKPLAIKALGNEAAGRKIKSVKLLGSSERVRWKQAADGLSIEPPKGKFNSDIALVYKLSLSQPSAPHLQAERPSLRTGNQSVGTMPISPKEPLPAVTGGDGEGWTNGEVPKLPALKPIVDVHMRDPNLCLGPDGTCYLVGSTGDIFRANDGIEMWKSKDLSQWERVGFVWTFAKDANDWQKGTLNPDGSRTPRPLWAPELHYIKGHWYMAYCIARIGCGVLKSTTDKPEGPYVDVHPKGPLPDDKHYDTSLFEDADGKVYFLAAHGWIARMKDDLSDLAEPLRHVTMEPNCPWHEYEGPWMMKLNGRYYLFVAQGSSHEKDGQRAGPGLKKSYDVWAMSGPTPYGPFGNRHLAFPYAGHNSVFQGSDGRWWSTWGTSDRNESIGLPFFEKPAIIPIEMDCEGKLRPVTP